MSTPNLNRRFFLRGKSAPPTASVVRPPWAVKESLFLESCERCDDCITACPENILIRGDGGFPHVDFTKGECTFCKKCSTACQAGAIQHLDTDTARQDYSPPAKAWNLDVSISKKCLSLNAVVCRACGDNCEPQAIRFQLKVGGIAEPHISLDDCTGCGACLATCPVNAVNIKPATNTT